jgi:hypothetical protein
MLIFICIYLFKGLSFYKYITGNLKKGEKGERKGRKKGERKQYSHKYVGSFLFSQPC